MRMQVRPSGRSFRVKWQEHGEPPLRHPKPVPGEHELAAQISPCSCLYKDSRLLPTASSRDPPSSPLGMNKCYPRGSCSHSERHVAAFTLTRRVSTCSVGHQRMHLNVTNAVQSVIGPAVANPLTDNNENFGPEYRHRCSWVLMSQTCTSHPREERSTRTVIWYLLLLLLLVIDHESR